MIEEGCIGCGENLMGMKNLTKILKKVPLVISQCFFYLIYSGDDDKVTLVLVGKMSKSPRIDCTNHNSQLCALSYRAYINLPMGIAELNT